MKNCIAGLLRGTEFRLILSVCAITLSSGCTALRSISAATSPQVQTLETSLGPLKAEFNRDPSKPRLLALFSPTCEGCIYGAKALQQTGSRLEEKPGERKVAFWKSDSRLPVGSDWYLEAREALDVTQKWNGKGKETLWRAVIFGCFD
jgi:hypothetical protein